MVLHLLDIFEAATHVLFTLVRLQACCLIGRTSSQCMRHSFLHHQNNTTSGFFRDMPTAVADAPMPYVTTNQAWRPDGDTAIVVIFGMFTLVLNALQTLMSWRNMNVLERRIGRTGT